MNASAKFNALPLRSVKPALDAALDKVGSSLERYFASNGEDKAGLQEALEEIHRANGVLRMLSLQGVLVFCGELQKLLQEFSEGGLQPSPMHQEIIQRALLILTHFLNSLAEGAPNAALRLFDPYQELLQARGIEAAFEIDLFFPALNIELPRAVHDIAQTPDAQAAIKAARSQYQQSLLKWLRQDNAAEALQVMHAAVQQVLACVPPDKRAFWWVSTGLLDCLIFDGLPPELNAKKLLGRIDLQMKALSEGGGGDEHATLTEMLYLLARSHAVSETVDEIKRRYALDEFLPEEPPLPPSETSQVLEQMRPLLNSAKETWEKCQADGGVCTVFAEQAEQLFALSEQLDRNTLQLLCKQIQTAAVQTGDAEYRRHVMMNMAIALMLLESGVEHYTYLGSNFHEQVRIVGLRLQPATVEAIGEQEAQLLVQLHGEMAQREIFPLLAEAMSANLEQVEQELNAFFADNNKRGELTQLVKLLSQVQGGLHMISQDAAAKLAGNARQAVTHYAEGATPTLSETDTIAASISALGAYVHDLGYGHKPDSAPLESLLGELHAPAAKEEAPSQQQADVPTALATGIIAQAPETEDNEMLEVFLEEAQEVLGILRSNLELSQLHPDSNEPLVTMRRGFHTLKGSGRMVGLNDFGEVAWSVERAMNKWLQDNKPATPALLRFIANAEALFHAWVDALSNRTGTVLDPAPLLVAAKQVEDGTLPEVVEESQPAVLQGMPDMQDVLAVAEAAEPETEAVESEKAKRAIESMSFETLVSPVAEARKELEQPVSNKPMAVPDMAELLDVATESEPHLSHEEPSAIEELPFNLPTSLSLDLPSEEATSGSGGEFDIPDLQAMVEEEIPAVVEAAQEPSVVQSPDLDFPQLQLDEGLPELALTEKLSEQSGIETQDLVLPDIEAIQLGQPLEESSLPELVPAENVPGQGVVEDVEEEDLVLPDVDTMQMEQALEESSLPDLSEILPASLSVSDEAESASTEITPSPVARLEAELDEGSIKVGSITLPQALFEIATEESASNLSRLQEGLAEMRTSTPPVVSHDFMRAAHTLAGVNRTMGFVPVADLSRALELWLEPRITKPFTLSAGQVEMVEQAIGILDAMFLDICNHQEPQAEPQLIARLNADQEKLLSAEVVVAAPASHAVVPPSAQAGEEMTKAVWGGVQETAPKLNWGANPLATAAAPGKPEPEAVRKESEPQAAIKLVSDNPEPVDVQKAAETPKEMSEAARPVPSTAQTEAVPESPQRIRQLVEERSVQDEIDEELLPIFLEETVDLQPQVSNNLRVWRGNPEENQPAANLQRVLHTLKGSARMAGVMRLGELVHRMEDRVIAAMKGRRDESLWDELESYSDRIGNALDRLRSGERGAEEAPAVALVAAESTPAEVLAAPEQQAPAVADVQTTEPTQTKQEVPAERAAAMLRVRSDTVDRLVNEAGEISVARSRIEAELRAVKTGLSDMTESVARLRKQLREIEIQAESQMEARVAQAKETHEQFDPLEFDRFSRFQELTRFMGESVHDVQTVQQTLLKNLDEVASAMSAQAYLNRSVQQSLMAIRMVPFSGIANRLYRIVRQSAKDMNKRANLDIRGGEVELDRSVLDRMTAPFEHLLRNSLAHGVESQEERNRSNKQPIGQIYIAVRQESNEIVFEVGDDGAGINVDRLRQKAVENGLAQSGTSISDEEAMLLIFQAGVSTASEVSEIAGRGVGMDVVRNEIVALGGQISVHSERGKGTRFTIRLPLTLAVAQILMIRSGSEHFAIPSVMVEQVLHIKPDVLEASYKSGLVAWQGTDYPLRYLPRLLGNEEHQPESRLHNPVLLLRSGDQRMALHVDELFGNQETVVKNIGPQLSRLPGVAGATVTSSGHVVLILNPIALTQRAIVTTTAAPAATEGEITKAAPTQAAAPHAVPVVMVVDDSLTVRKVSSRMLTRAGYEVVTAKDGVDALEQLTEIKPSVMLLDVEMPRMDGFELTRQIRRDPKLHDIPILMITSRTAEKHRDYALELGVNAYFGKPFQEEELLQQIATFIKGR